MPHVDDSDRVSIETLRLGFVAITATYGYQDEPDVVARAASMAQRQGLEIDLDRTSYYVDHVTILPTGRARMARWRKRLFVLLHQNSIPVGALRTTSRPTACSRSARTSSSEDPRLRPRG